MSKTITIITLIALVGLVAAESDCNWLEKPAWWYANGAWVPTGVGNPAARARCWTWDVPYQDSCNKQIWHMTVKHEASVAQWIILGTNCDGFHWGVRKPGKYSADCMRFWAMSNQALRVSFDGFENLHAVHPESVIHQEIPVHYALVPDEITNPPAPDDTCWHTAADLNQISYYIPDSYDLHWTGWSNHLWTYIDVDNCNSAGAYVDPNWACVTITLQKIQPWIDPVTGQFASMPPFPYQ